METILDFTSIRNLYDGADPKTVAIVCSSRTPGRQTGFISRSVERLV